MMGEDAKKLKNQKAEIQQKDLRHLSKNKNVKTHQKHLRHLSKLTKKLCLLRRVPHSQSRKISQNLEKKIVTNLCRMKSKFRLTLPFFTIRGFNYVPEKINLVRSSLKIVV